MKKVVQINVVSNVLSTGKITNDISKVAISHGWETYVAYGRYEKPGYSYAIKIGDSLNTYFHYAADRLLDNEGLASTFATYSFLKQLDDIKPDIIHLHNIHDHFINYPLLFQYIADHHIPVVWTQHDCWAFTGGCAYFDVNGCLEWKNGCKVCKYRNPIFRNKSSRNFKLKEEFLGKIDKLVFVPVSEWLADIMSQSVQKTRPIKVIHNGMDISIFKPIPKKQSTTTFNILGIAAPWSERKGLTDFIKLRSMLSDDFHITLVGLSKKQIKDLPEGIVGIERTFNVDELVKLYSDSDVFVNPTYSDNFPTTNLEALACGTPVITYNTGGSPEAIDRNTGIVVERGNVDSLLKAILSMRESPIKQNECRQRAEILFNKETNFEKYITLYEELLK